MTAPAHATGPGAACAPSTSWSTTRILFLLAGAMTLIGVALSASVSSWFLIIPALVGANQLLMVIAGWCPMSLLMDRFGIGASLPTGPVPPLRA